MKQEEKNQQHSSAKETGQNKYQPVQNESGKNTSAPENDIDRFEGNMDHGETGGNLHSTNKNKDDEQRTSKQ